MEELGKRSREVNWIAVVAGVGAIALGIFDIVPGDEIPLGALGFALISYGFTGSVIPFIGR